MINSDLEIGQVLWLKVRYQIDVVSTVKHPMIIAEINDDYIEVIALDKIAGKLHQLFHYYNFYISNSEPKETVINEDSYAQLNTKLTIDNIEELKNSRKTLKKLSSKKLNELLKEYKDYQNNHNLDEQRVVHMSRDEILKLNPEIDKITIPSRG